MITSLLFRAVAWIASIVVAFSNLGAAAEKKPSVPTWDQKYYEQQLNKRTLRFAPKWDITYHDVLLEAFDDLKERGGLDVPAASAALKDPYSTHRWIVKLFPGLIYSLRDKWMAKGDEWDKKNDPVKMVFYRLLGLCIAMPTKVKIVAEPQDDLDPHVNYEIFIDCTYVDGSVRRLKTFSKFNTETGEFGEPNGISGLGFNFNFNFDGNGGPYAYTTKKSWQRSLGYMKLYDIMFLQTTKMDNIGTVRLKFDYAGKDWMLQLWKGRYLNTTGGEIGIYNKPKDRKIGFYDVAGDNELVYMSFKIIAEDDGRIADPVVIDRPVMYSWWMTGFGVQKYQYLANQLTLESLLVPIDAAMYNALKAAMDREKVSYEEIEWAGCDENGWTPTPAFYISW